MSCVCKTEIVHASIVSYLSIFKSYCCNNWSSSAMFVSIVAFFLFTTNGRCAKYFCMQSSISLCWTFLNFISLRIASIKLKMRKIIRLFIISQIYSSQSSRNGESIIVMAHMSLFLKSDNLNINYNATFLFYS